MKRLFVSATVVLALCFASFTVSAKAYTSIAVFGDSLSDGGNDFIYTGGIFPPPPYAQRFTNGPTAVENLAANLGLSLLPSESGGTNYAYGGAETGTANYLRMRPGVPSVINAIFSGNDTGILAQVQSVPAGFADTGTLAVLWGGSNDLFSGLTLGLDPASIIASAMANLSQSVGLLHGKGARDILMPNLPNIGVTPFALGTDPAGITAFSEAFNISLHQLVDNLEFALPGLNLIEVDSFAVSNAIAANPGAYGFTNSTSPCFDGVTACSNPDEYVFWDDVHLTARANVLFGDVFAHAVPETPAVLLMVFGLIGMVVVRRKVYSLHPNRMC